MPDDKMPDHHHFYVENGQLMLSWIRSLPNQAIGAPGAGGGAIVPDFKIPTTGGTLNVTKHIAEIVRRILPDKLPD